MTMVTASAPGKLMLLGEHAVVYGYPCIVTAVDLRYQVSVERQSEAQIEVETPAMRTYGQRYSNSLDDVLGQTELPRTAAFVLAAVRRLYAHTAFRDGVRIWTDGPPVSYGLGSSSAVTVATVAAMAEVFDVRLTRDEICTIATQAVLEVQGTGSGFDVAAAVYGGTLYFEGGGKTIDSIKGPGLPIVIGFSGEKVSTTNLVAHVRQLRDSHPELVGEIFSLIGKLVQQAKPLLAAAEWQGLGDLLDINQGLLDALGVSTLQLSKQIYAARQAGAYGAKLSGAGGGDCMFALVEPGKEHRVVQEIVSAGGIHVSIDTGAQGVRIESEPVGQP